MDKFLQVVGWIGVGAVALILLNVMINAGRGQYAALAVVASLTWAAPSIVGFVLIAAFGNMLGQLKAIRAASERQAEMFSEIMARGKNTG
ncbi:hypothetical protein RMS29_023490 [Agrobacterium rosae]|uniref:Uncharacterized protein n=1 Tax=Agrobacterium rosae TaxID=1972867 RepID=A0AAE5VQT5_9HYPH|nr:hypothetical protein [Agrobacterium rosae]KAA3509680.1 hypothetical protein DXM21_21740 [Agrobacterium rosae]KAA3516581.1 hypothetical protein DXM25_19945 [Agrobacterium rosae]MCM2435101.1 hypothetical protein [Agrobacterium rosae]MDX8330675.1 hypothetical protein [Agrobacterium rosae]MQB50389.1 hypothetical protein [Agrobacterium rosae]